MSAPACLIRPATGDDLAAVVAIERQSFGDPWSPAALAQELAIDALRLPLVAEVAGEVAGYLMAWRSADQLHILNLAVAPSQRRRSIATRLLLAAREEARRCGLVEMTLEVRPGNIAAQGLYASLGFRPAGRRAGYYADTGEDALILTLDLDENGPR